MTVIELINTLKDMPHNAQIYVELDTDTGKGTRSPHPEMEYNSLAENFLVVL